MQRSAMIYLCCAVLMGFAPTVHSQQHGLKRHEAVRYQQWLLDLETLTLADTNQQHTLHVVWNVNTEIRKEGHWSYQDRSLVEVTLDNGTKLLLNIRENVKNNTLTGYTISATAEGQKSQAWEYTPQQNGGLGKSMRICDAHDSAFIVIYSPIATGSDVVCVDLVTGKGIWEGEVKQMMVSHSKYRNEVYIRKVGSRIIVAGDEAGGKYLQVLDARTGKNIWNVSNSEW